jgi:hypothetical protein
MTQEELSSLKVPLLLKLAEKHGVQWANVHGQGRHLRKGELVAALAQRLQRKEVRIPERVIRVIRLADGAEIARFSSMTYAGIFWRGLVQINESARLKFRMEEIHR